MNGLVIVIFVFVVAVLVGPFLTLRAVTRFRQRRDAAKPVTPARPYDDDDDKSSF